MAVSKIKAIKSTLDKAISYIANPEKTEDCILLSSFGCAPETAALEFQITAKQGSRNGNRLGYHLMQSFSPEDELDAKKAHELGVEFAKKVTNGKYEFVIATHVDKDHLHNHIIFNATSFVDKKKYHYGAWEKNRIRGINDKICRDNNLSVIEKYTGRRGRGNFEYTQSQAGTSWKDKLCKAIDFAVMQAKDFDDFLLIMEMEGYEIKRGKYISFRGEGQERFTRAKRIGEAYTEEAIRERIVSEDKEKNTGKVEKTPSAESTGKQKSENSRKPKSNKISLLVDISKNIKAQNSKGYERALARVNIDNLVKSMNYLIRHNIVTPEDFSVYASGMKAEYELTRKSIKRSDNELIDLSEKIKFVQNYKKYKAVYMQSLKEKWNKDFYIQHEEEIVQYKASLIYFERNGISPNELKLSDLFNQYKNMKEENSELKRNFGPIKEAYKEMNIVKSNIEDALGYKLTESTKGKEEKKKDDIEK